ncbi:SDR family NAD(P)-dependent oxidoreductase [Actinomadura sp. HBU206391]|nr:SDR family NAD(P)-dependent oxidoreductase [Actinomadura sp. HBU206391]
MQRLEGRVTGGASGIGLATVGRLAAEGTTVVIADLDEASGEEAAASVNEQGRFIRADVTSEGPQPRRLRRGAAREPRTCPGLPRRGRAGPGAGGARPGPAVSRHLPGPAGAQRGARRHPDPAPAGRGRGLGHAPAPGVYGRAPVQVEPRSRLAAALGEALVAAARSIR